jgi:L,D-peptidoglycan transpeptidase YkuD (ErfK/YbiS/YcfS/YnhG family)
MDLIVDLYSKDEKGCYTGHIGNQAFKCAVGRSGFIEASEKKEGDGSTPMGIYPLREVYYNPDHIKKPHDVKLPLHTLSKDMGWCDDPQDDRYNQLIKLPYKQNVSFENLYREDEVYDLIVVVGYNDSPALPSKGSAIFIHVKHNDYEPTAGCLAFSKDDLLEILKLLTPESQVCIGLKAL